MQRVASCFARDAHKGGAIQVRANALSRQRDGGIRFADVSRVSIVLRVRGDGFDAEFGSRPGNADGDLAPVGDEQSAQGHGQMGYP